MQRHAIGAVGVALLLAWLTLFILQWIHGYEGAAYVQVKSMSGRIGVVMVMWWAAYYDLRRLPGWLWVVIPFAILLIALGRGRYVIVLIPLILLVMLLMPRKRRPRQRRE